MQYKICRDSYHMFYIIGTEDAFVRRGLNKPPPSTLTNNTKWNQWLDNHWSQGLTDQEKLQAEQEAFTLFQ
jgi:paired amphipathic helix protein Sin3a